MRRFSALAMVLIAAALPAGEALGAFAGGTYRGETSASEPITLKLAKGKRKLSDLRVTVTFTCSDGDSFTLNYRLAGYRILTNRVRSTGRLEVRTELSGPDGVSGRAIVRGRLKGRRGSGTVDFQARFDPDGTPNPVSGTVTCTGGALRWTARRR
jgi:hypothetical protein